MNEQHNPLYAEDIDAEAEFENAAHECAERPNPLYATDEDDETAADALFEDLLRNPKYYPNAYVDRDGRYHGSPRYVHATILNPARNISRIRNEDLEIIKAQIIAWSITLGLGVVWLVWHYWPVLWAWVRK